MKNGFLYGYVFNAIIKQSFEYKFFLWWTTEPNLKDLHLEIENIAQQFVTLSQNEHDTSHKLYMLQSIFAGNLSLIILLCLATFCA